MTSKTDTTETTTEATETATPVATLRARASAAALKRAKAEIEGFEAAYEAILREEQIKVGLTGNGKARLTEEQKVAKVLGLDPTHPVVIKAAADARKARTA